MFDKERICKAFAALIDHIAAKKHASKNLLENESEWIYLVKRLSKTAFHMLCSLRGTRRFHRRFINSQISCKRSIWFRFLPLLRESCHFQFGHFQSVEFV